MTRELDYVKSPRPALAQSVEAAKKGDAKAAREALREYDYAWNGIEVYVSHRSRELYLDLEMEHQKKVEEMLDSGSPDMSKVTTMLEETLALYDQAIKNSETGAPVSPIFDEVAAIRVARQGLRAAGPALKSGDVAKAKTGFADFQKQWPGVQDLIKQRSADAHKEIDTAIAQLDQGFQQSKSAADLSALLSTLIDKYTAGLNLVVAEARAAK